VRLLATIALVSHGGCCCTADCAVLAVRAAHLGTPSFVTDPTNDSVIYTVNAGCIAASYDTGDTWSPCWNQPPPPPSADAAGFHKSAGDLSAGHDIQVANMTETAAEVWCKAQANCSGFTAHSAGGADTVKKIYFKQNLFRPMGSDPTWVTYVKVAKPSGPAPPPTEHSGLVGSFGGLTIKDSMNMIVTRNNDVPLRTKDGGATWTPMDSCKLVANVRGRGTAPSHACSCTLRGIFNDSDFVSPVCCAARCPRSRRCTMACSTRGRQRLS
jgi:hypothetical protein